MNKAYFGPSTKTVAIVDDETNNIIAIYSENTYSVDIKSRQVFCADEEIHSEKTGIFRNGHTYPIDKQFIADFTGQSDFAKKCKQS